MRGAGDPDARRPLRQRVRLEYRQVVTTPSRARFVVKASPRSLAGEPDQWPMPWFAVLAWVAVRQVALMIRRQPRWQVEVAPVLDPNAARIVMTGSRVDALQRVTTEVSRLASS